MYSRARGQVQSAPARKLAECDASTDGYLVFADARLVYALSVGATHDSCPAPTCIKYAGCRDVRNEVVDIGGLPHPSIRDSEYMRR
jgi:hypothetical protein